MTWSMLADVELSTMQIVLAIAIVALGTAIQASIGFGLAMIAAPLLILVNRIFVPAPLIATALVLVLWMAYKDRRHIDFSSIKIAVVGRCLGTPPAAWLLGVISTAVFDIMFALLVLSGVVISLVHNNIKSTPKAVFFASIASGFMSTISAIGGPPIALVYQNSKGSELRANLSILFIVGCSISLIALAVIDRFNFSDLPYVAILLVGVAFGIGLSVPVRKILDKRTARPYLLALCCLSASVVLLRALLI